MGEFELFSGIIKLSNGTDWESARDEWVLAGIYLDESKESVCVCGKENIKECCCLLNMVNGNEAIVGNVCVNKFNTVPNTVFAALRDRRFNDDLIEFLYRFKLINKWEWGFLKDTWRKRILSVKQVLIKEKLECRIFNNPKLIRKLSLNF